MSWSCATQLLPLDENGDNEEGNVWIYRYFEDEKDPDAEPVIEYIEDDDEYDKVAAAYNEFLDESEHDELLMKINIISNRFHPYDFLKKRTS